MAFGHVSPHDLRGAEERAQGTATGQRQPVTGKVTVTLFNPTGETSEQRRQRLALATGTRRSLWK